VRSIAGEVSGSSATADVRRMRENLFMEKCGR
jgi:hypothetical protein